VKSTTIYDDFDVHGAAAFGNPLDFLAVFSCENAAD
jgi:hypothetical protein